MQYKKVNLDLAAVNSNSHFLRKWEQSIIEKYKLITEDVDRNLRINVSLCKRCYLGDFLGGAAMTSCYCGLCDTEMIFGSTNVDKLCLECAKKHKLCKHCAADIDGTLRKKL